MAIKQKYFVFQQWELLSMMDPLILKVINVIRKRGSIENKFHNIESCSCEKPMSLIVK
jgi:hypothetical protein